MGLLQLSNHVLQKSPNWRANDAVGHVEGFNIPRERPILPVLSPLSSPSPQIFYRNFILKTSWVDSSISEVPKKTFVKPRPPYSVKLVFLFLYRE